MLCDRAFGQFAKICRSSGNFASPYRSISLATLYRPPAAGLALDQQGRDEKVREGVGVVFHALGGLGLSGQVFGPQSPDPAPAQCQNLSAKGKRWSPLKRELRTPK
jgi:hypothetical protein